MSRTINYPVIVPQVVFVIVVVLFFASVCGFLFCFGLILLDCGLILYKGETSASIHPSLDAFIHS